jgi:hypothetical protein
MENRFYLIVEDGKPLALVLGASPDDAVTRARMALFGQRRGKEVGVLTAEPADTAPFETVVRMACLSLLGMALAAWSQGPRPAH